MAGTMPKNPMDMKRQTRNERYFPVEKAGESKVMIVKIPIIVIPVR